MTTLRCIIAAAAAVTLGTGALVAAPSATAYSYGYNSRAVVNAWYEDFLGRDAEQDLASQYWVDQLNALFPPSDQLWKITHSEEFDAGIVDEYYRVLLGRAPDPGARYWINGITAQRFPKEWALQNILASPEYRAGKDNAALVFGWYTALLSRTPSAGEIAYWSERVNLAGPLDAVRELYYANEAVALRITTSYNLLLDRNPEAREVSYWYPKEVENSVNVQVLIGATEEYRYLAE